MNENNLNEQPTEEQKTSDKAKQKLREISGDKLKQIIENHKRWLESDGKKGKQADLGGINLKKVRLKGANLQKVRLGGVNLQQAYLVDANLQMASLGRANLQQANLGGANLQEAFLGRANLQEAFLGKVNLEQANLNRANLQQANLGGANLQVASLDGANLQEASLDQANLQGANFRRANLQEAFLGKANLQNSDFTRSDMRYTVLDGVKGLSTADIQYANMEDATGLLGNEFAQADVSGTKLPKDIIEFKALETVEKTSQNARKIFFAMLLGCVYSWLTIATTTDVRLLTNTASSPLPIIGTEIPIAWFYIAAPLVLICLYFYFHLILDNLWGALASLPAIFPDGKRLDERAYPWLLNTLVRRHFKRLKSRPLIARMKEWITIFLAWFVVPITMIVFWLRYIPRHDWVGTIFHIGLIVLSVAFAIIFYRLCAMTLQGKEKVDFRFKYFWRDRTFYYAGSVIVVAILFSLLSYGSVDGIRLVKPKVDEIKKVTDFYYIKVSVPWAFDKLGYDVFANFREKEVSERPINYWEITEKYQLKSVKGANLKGRNLNNADIYKAFLVKADLRYALLNNANISEANLHKANLYNANLHQAILRLVNLKETDLRETNFQQADLYKANLENSNLRRANLQSAYIANANLRNANLRKANLKHAELGLKAYIPQSPLFSVWLRQTNYLGANLQQANLREANLQHVNFLGANLQESNLSEADLIGAYNITIEQLSKVKTLYKAKLDPELMEQVKKCCPHLLEEPKEETDKTN